jgi:hypothetical protein
MTNYPTLLGDGGHAAGNQTYSSMNYYSNVGLGRCAMVGSSYTTESYFSQTIRVAGAISYLSWGLDTAFGAALTLTLKKNSSSSALAVSIGASTTGWVTDSTHSVSVSSDDVLDFATHLGAGTVSGYSGSFYCVSARFDSSDATTASAQMIGSMGPSPVSQSTTVKPISFLGIASNGALSEDTQQIYALTAGKWQNMACNIENNTTSATTTITNRIGGSNGSMSISVGQSQTGYFEDPTGSDTVTVGNLVNYAIVCVSDNNSGSFDLQWIGAHFLATSPPLCLIGGSAGNPVSIGSGSTLYSSLFGGGSPSNPPNNPQTRSTGKFPYALSASKFTNHLVDPTSGSATFTLLKNGSSALAVSSSAGHTGYIMSDLTETVAFNQGDTCANQITTGSSGTVTWASAALLLQASS